jgi:hypothetical protein
MTGLPEASYVMVVSARVVVSVLLNVCTEVMVGAPLPGVKPRLLYFLQDTDAIRITAIQQLFFEFIILFI